MYEYDTQIQDAWYLIAREDGALRNNAMHISWEEMKYTFLGREKYLCSIFM